MSSSLPLLFIVIFLGFPSSTVPTETTLPFTKTKTPQLQTFIVHLDLPSDDDTTFSGREDVKRWYASFLPAEEGSRMVHTYHTIFTGFAAKLSPLEVKSMKQMKGFLSARPQRLLSLQTTHSPGFLGLDMGGGAWPKSNYGKNVIIGVVDTGITPAHPSFDDTGMPPPPAKWKGRCQLNGTKTCNNKLIGARSFLTGGAASLPLDDAGHGTHTSSTAAGNFVRRASIYGQANGTAVGMAPMSHVAMYRACDFVCPESAILAAMDAAVEDGVDILSLSIGGPSMPFHSDLIAVGAFGAMKKGVLVTCAAGNDGPFPRTLSNEAPWILTVGASTTDRSIKATALLGNNESYDGQSLNQSGKLPPTLFPLFYSNETSSCYSFRGVDIKGKVVLCQDSSLGSSYKGQVVKNAGGVGMILANTFRQGDFTWVLGGLHVLPATQVSYIAGERIKKYINSTKSPVASISFGGTAIGFFHEAPFVAEFSSRGPSIASPGILKPDVIGPGVDILAAWKESVDGITRFQIDSGTSMACPHISGIAALIKSVHPDWSPAAIKSAIMTTADQLNHAKKPILDHQLKTANVFAIGAGHVNPSRALDPGLVYDIQPKDYIAYLCGLGYNDTQVYAVTNSKVKCSTIAAISEAELNYPSFAVKLANNRRVNQTYPRTVTNVGPANSSYVCRVTSPNGVDISCAPGILHFSEVNQKMTYQVTFTWSGLLISGYVEGSLAWRSTNSKHIVRLPISISVE